MLTPNPTKTVSVKMAHDLVEQTESFARAEQKHISEYIREAVREKNERQLAERIKFLAAKFSDEAQALVDDFDEAMGDGLAKS